MGALRPERPSHAHRISAPTFDKAGHHVGQVIRITAGNELAINRQGVTVNYNGTVALAVDGVRKPQRRSPFHHC